MPDKPKCPHVLLDFKRCEKHDALYCEPCDIWIEPKCSRAFCSLCETRPEKPSEVIMKKDDDKVVNLNARTTLPIPVERVVNGLVEEQDKIESILILSFTKDGNLDARSNTSEVGLLLELMEQYKFNLLSGMYGRD